MNSQVLFLIGALLSSLAIAASAQTAAPLPPSASRPAAPTQIIPGALWPDDRGQHVQAHGGGILKLGDRYFWFGEQRAENLDRTKRFVSCYSSDDLLHWTFRNNVLQQSDPENFGPRWILERPKVFYNAPTKTFVMYMHIDGPLNGSAYGLARVGVATCKTVDGDYHYLRSFRPLGRESRDIGQFMDDDGAAYLIFEDRPAGFHIARLSDDYLDVAKDICLIPQHLEGGALVHYQDLYYVVGSELTGWRANPNKFATSKSLAGPWSAFKDIAPPATNTYGAQSSMLLKVVGTQSTSILFMGDIWKPAQQSNSRYLWMPIQIGNGNMALPEPRPWSINTLTGVVKLGPPPSLPPGP